MDFESIAVEGGASFGDHFANQVPEQTPIELNTNNLPSLK